MTPMALVTGANGFAGRHWYRAFFQTVGSSSRGRTNLLDPGQQRQACLARALEIRSPAYKGLHRCPEALFWSQSVVATLYSQFCRTHHQFATDPLPQFPLPAALIKRLDR